MNFYEAGKANRTRHLYQSRLLAGWAASQDGRIAIFK